MPHSKARREALTRQARTGESYARAHRIARDLAASPSPAELDERGVAGARARRASFSGDDWSMGARTAQSDLFAVEEWEGRSDGRQVRLWDGVIEVRTSAVDEDDASLRLGSYVRWPLHRAGSSNGLLSGEEETGEDTPGEYLARIDESRLTAAERRLLTLDYAPAALGVPGGPFSERQGAHVQDYLESLHRAHLRLLGHFPAGREAELDRDRGLLLEGADLTFWRARRHAWFLAGPGIESARERAAELASTIVDYAGRPAGRVVSITPDDGFRHAVDGLWCHPATLVPVTELWDDYDLAEHSTGEPAAVAALLAFERAALDSAYHRDAREIAEHEARLHLQPDGARTLSTPAELRAAAAACRKRYAGTDPAVLRQKADEADYMASRVYGKAVDNDQDYKRIEYAEHEARTLRAMASEIEDQTTAGLGQESGAQR